MESKSSRNNGCLDFLLTGVAIIFLLVSLDLKSKIGKIESDIKIQPKIEFTKQGDTIYVYEIQQR